jgi:hypothetical protein
MKQRLMLASMLLAAFLPSCISIGLAQASSSGSKVAPKESPKRKLRLGLVGYLPLPEGYEAYRTKDLRDAWYGYIVSPDNKIRINWSSGLVQTPFQEGEGKFVWVKRENIPKGVLKYGLMRTDDEEVIAATVGWVNLYMPVKAESDIDLFLGIARSYKMEKCDDCERPLPAPPSNNGMQRTRRTALPS